VPHQLAFLLRNEAIRDVKDAAASQGLTTAAAKEASATVSRKAQTVASSARDSIGNRVL